MSRGRPLGPAGTSACAWSFYISCFTFTGISPEGAPENSPRRKPNKR